jgi:glycine/D-amino acid oxidase-like deaminating enzyme
MLGFYKVHQIRHRILTVYINMTNINKNFNIVIIGGGFFGCSLAINLKKRYEQVLVVEREDDILQRASYANQARVHNGYHYPRSILTALRSRVNFPRFVEDYADCIFKDFEQYYAIGRNFSMVSANQFRIFMERIGAEITPAPKRIRDLTNPGLVEEIFRVKEYAFDAVKLREHVRREILQTGVNLLLSTQITRVEGLPNKKINLHYKDQSGNQNAGVINACRVYNCTYSHLNQVLLDSRLPVIPLKHEVTEMALLELPEELQGIGITVMCGPFFSFMPFPPLALHTLSHVRYTPHHFWLDNEDNYLDPYQHLERLPRKSNAEYMLKDAQRFIPALGKARHLDSIWEVKTVLPQSEVDDSRPILIKKEHGIPGLTCIMGGKIDNIYDVFEELEGEF